MKNTYGGNSFCRVHLSFCHFVILLCRLNRSVTDRAAYDGLLGNRHPYLEQYRSSCIVEKWRSIVLC